MPERLRITLANPSRAHAALLLPSAARLLPANEVEPLLDRVRDLSSCAGWDALRAEASGLLTGDSIRLREAAPGRDAERAAVGRATATRSAEARSPTAAAVP